MFKLTEIELDSAFRAIEHHGYSTMLPEPPEWAVVSKNWAALRSALTQVDLESYVPNTAMKVFAPKNRANVRLIHMLHPEDLLIYTALVLIAKNDIESSRISIRSKRVFSFRSSNVEPDHLYSSKGAYVEYLKRLSAKAMKANVHFVAVADIADFYPRIYQHRLENAIESVATTPRVKAVAKVLVGKFISKLMGRNSYGIPVGPYASRVLGEAVLIDVDSFLRNHSIDFVRWVDDYNFFCKTEYDAQSQLFSLGEWLFTNHGLTLQTVKTKILTVDRFRKEALREPSREITNRDQVVSMLRDFSAIDVDEQGEEILDSERVQNTIDAIQSLDLLGMLRKSVSDSSLVDYEAISYALTKLPLIPGAPDDLKNQILDLVIQNAALLYPVAEQIARYVLSFVKLTRAEQERIAKMLLSPLKNGRNPPPPYYAMWILHVFATNPQWNHARDMVQIYLRANSEVIKRQAALVVASSGTRSEALAIKESYAQASPMLRLAILFASRRLGEDERKHWKLANQVSGTLEKLI